MGGSWLQEAVGALAAWSKEEAVFLGGGPPSSQHLRLLPHKLFWGHQAPRNPEALSSCAAP